MKWVQAYSLVALFLISTGGLYILYGTFKSMLKMRQLVGGDGDEALKKVAEGLDILHMLFGPKVSTSSVFTAEGRIIDIACRFCNQRNRLIKGFRGAKCGSCKRPLTILEDKQKESVLN